MADVIRAAERLRTRLRGREPDDVIKVTPAEISVLDQGLCALIDAHAKGKPMRQWWKKAKAAQQEG